MKQNNVKDFTINNMPHNRKDVFFDIIKNRFSTLLFIGLFIFISIIPMILIIFYSSLEGTNIANSNLEEEKITSALIALEKTKFMLLTISSIFLAISLSGASAVIQKLIWQEGFIFKSIFKKGIKENFLVYLISYLSLFILIYVLVLLIYNNSGNIVTGIALAAIVLLGTIINLTTSQTNIYKLPIFGYFKNGFIMSMASFLKTFLVLIINVLPLLLFLIPNMVVETIVMLILPIVIAPILLLLNTLYANYIYDKYINKDKYPNIYDKGVYRECQK